MLPTLVRRDFGSRSEYISIFNLYRYEITKSSEDLGYKSVIRDNQLKCRYLGAHLTPIRSTANVVETCVAIPHIIHEIFVSILNFQIKTEFGFDTPPSTGIFVAFQLIHFCYVCLDQIEWNTHCSLLLTNL